jgi:F0F1-type ATP synthase gamma subunit
MSYEELLERERKTIRLINEIKEKLISNMEFLVLVQNLQKLVDEKIVHSSDAKLISIFNQEIINDYLEDVKKVNGHNQDLYMLGQVRRKYYKA